MRTCHIPYQQNPRTCTYHLPALKAETSGTCPPSAWHDFHAEEDSPTMKAQTLLLALSGIYMTDNNARDKWPEPNSEGTSMW